MRQGGTFLGLVLVAIGGVLLLITLGLVQADIWRLVLPSLVIVLGLWLLWGAVFGRKEPSVERVSVPLEAAKEARVRLHFGAGRLMAGGGAAPGELMACECTGGVDMRRRREGDRQVIDVRLPPDGFLLFGLPWLWAHPPEWSLRFSQEVPLTLEVEAGASDAHLDLSDLQVKRLRLQTGASAVEVTMPSAAGQTKASIEAGAASVRLHVPEGVAARIRAKGGLSEIKIDRNRFPRGPQGYQSPDFDSAEHRVEIDLQTGVGSVEIS